MLSRLSIWAMMGKRATNMGTAVHRNQQQEILVGQGEDASDRSVPDSAAVAVAVDGDKNSKSAVKWALDHLVSQGDSVALIHVRPPVVSVPTPMGSYVPITQLCDDVVAAYMEQVESDTYEKLLPYQRLCNSKKVRAEIMVIEDNDIPKAIAEYISNSGTEKIVMGSSSRNAIIRRFKPPDVPANVSKIAPNFCTLYVISKGKLSSVRSAFPLAPIRGTPGDIRNHSRFGCDISSRNYPPNRSEASELTGQRESKGRDSNMCHSESLSPHGHKAFSIGNQIMSHGISNPGGSAPNTDEGIFKSQISGVENSVITNTPGSQGTESIDTGSSFLVSSVADTNEFQPHNVPNIEGEGYSDRSIGFQDPTGYSGLSSIAENSNPENGRFIKTSNKRSMESGLATGDSDKLSMLCETHSRTSSSQSMFTQEEIGSEVENLKPELKQTQDFCRVACEEATYAKQTAREILGQRGEETRKFEAEQAIEQVASAVASEDRAQHDATLNKAKAAIKMTEIEAQQTSSAEFITMREPEERKRVQDALASADQRYRKYSMEEIESATDFFSESLKIGEGSYGSVYKCMLDHMTVAIKVLHPDASHGWKQFQQEVEVLSRIHHSHMVLLLGACPEFGCLVYEYMANGSLEDRLFRRGGTPSLPWSMRFRIGAEIATGLLYLHSSKPEPFVHRDLKPANILLDENFVSKIGDVGLAKLVPPTASCSFTEYRNTTTSGTFCYIDPEYQRTGTLGTKSDLYALGVVLLQLLTAKPPMGLAYDVERAIQKRTFKEILDQTVGDWPVGEALNLAKLALKCVEMRRRDRPDLETVVLPELQRLKAVADGQLEPRRADSVIALPRHLFGPIFQARRRTASGEEFPRSINLKDRRSKVFSTNKFGCFRRKTF